MAKKSSGVVKHQIHEIGGEALEAAQAKKAGSNFEWHFGRLPHSLILQVLLTFRAR